MMIPCLLVLGVLFLGGDKLFSSGYLWPVLIGVFVIGHIGMIFMGRGKHGKRGGANTEENIDTTSAKPGGTSDKQKEHKHGSCCH